MTDQVAKRPKAVPGSTDARRITVSLSVTQEIKDALEFITKEKKSRGKPWSVNRELWERISYTFALTGLDGEIEPHVRELKADVDRMRARRDLGALIRERGDFHPFRYAGLPKTGDDLDGLPVDFNTEGRAMIDSLVLGLSEGVTPLRYEPVADIAQLRKRHAKAVAELAMGTDVKLRDSEYELLQILGEPENAKTLQRLMNEASEKWSPGFKLPDLALARKRSVSAINTEFEALQELSATIIIYDYLVGWRSVIDRRSEELEPHVEAADYADRLSTIADAAIAELVPIDDRRKTRVGEATKWAAATGEVILAVIESED